MSQSAIGAARTFLARIESITLDEFSKGGDHNEREALRAALKIEDENERNCDLESITLNAENAYRRWLDEHPDASEDDRQESVYNFTDEYNPDTPGDIFAIVAGSWICNEEVEEDCTKSPLDVASAAIYEHIKQALWAIEGEYATRDGEEDEAA